jgi:hypothetical protein
VPISESAAAKLLATDFRIGSDTVWGCRFLNQLQQSFWLPISGLATAQYLAADFSIASDIVWLLISESAVAQFSLPILELAATQFVAADFKIGSDTVKPNKKLLLDQPILRENWNRNSSMDSPKGG